MILLAQKRDCATARRRFYDPNQKASDQCGPPAGAAGAADRAAPASATPATRGRPSASAGGCRTTTAAAACAAATEAGRQAEVPAGSKMLGSFVGREMANGETANSVLLVAIRYSPFATPCAFRAATAGACWRVRDF